MERVRTIWQIEFLNLSTYLHTMSWSGTGSYEDTSEIERMRAQGRANCLSQTQSIQNKIEYQIAWRDCVCKVEFFVAGHDRALCLLNERDYHQCMPGATYKPKCSWKNLDAE